MDAILLAGGTPGPDEPLFHESNGRSKALIDIAGKPMAQWILDAISRSQRITRAFIIGVDSDSGLACNKPLTFIPDHGGLLENVLAGLSHLREISPTTTHVMLASTDIPTVSHEMIDRRIETAKSESADLDYVVVERAVMEARFPGSNRSFVRLKDVEVCGGDINLISLELAGKTDLWDRLVAARKSPRRQAALIGFDILFQLLIRNLTLKECEDKISRRLGLQGYVAISPYAEVAMDVDKPEQLEIVRQDLSNKMRAA